MSQRSWRMTRVGVAAPLGEEDRVGVGAPPSGSFGGAHLVLLCSSQEQKHFLVK